MSALSNGATFKLPSGSALPSVGLGLWKIPVDQTAAMVQAAIACGYRHLDGACDYGNEVQAGQGVKQAIQSGACRRDDLWITSKLWNTYHRPEHVGMAVKRSLKDWGLDAFDLYLIHFPIAQAFVPFETRYPPGWFFDPGAAKPQMQADSVPIADTWQAMEELVHAGLVKHIGISNFNTSLIRDLLSTAKIRPAVLQIEAHPYLVQPKLVRYCHQENIAVTAFSPLGAGSYVPLNMAKAEQSVLTEPSVIDIARRHERTPAQIVLRWAVQRGTSVIPKTSRVDRLRENISIFDFELTSDEMSLISALDRHQRFNDPGVFCEQAFNTFFPIYE